jgi:hypothetical protein
MKRVVLLIAVAVVTFSACGTDAGGDRLRASGRPTAAPPTPPRRVIPWDHPLVSGIPSTRALAKTQGRLAFDPIVPAWDVRESAVEVTNPSGRDPAHASVAFLYDFPTGADFPTDGRLVVIQTPTELTETDLARIAESNGAEHFRVIDINGRPALLVEADGIGRVRIIRGGVAIDITGPAAPPETVIRLATTLG